MIATAASKLRSAAAGSLDGVVDQAEARERAEMARLELERTLDVAHRGLVVAHQDSAPWRACSSPRRSPAPARPCDRTARAPRRGAPPPSRPRPPASARRASGVAGLAPDQPDALLDRLRFRSLGVLWRRANSGSSRASRWSERTAPGVMPAIASRAVAAHPSNLGGIGRPHRLPSPPTMRQSRNEANPNGSAAPSARAGARSALARRGPRPDARGAHAAVLMPARGAAWPARRRPGARSRRARQRAPDPRPPGAAARAGRQGAAARPPDTQPSTRPICSSCSSSSTLWPWRVARRRSSVGSGTSCDREHAAQRRERHGRRQTRARRGPGADLLGESALGGCRRGRRSCASGPVRRSARNS